MKFELAAIVLAAGLSRRMGRDKLALAWRGRRVLDWVLEAARALEHVVLVGSPEPGPLPPDHEKTVNAPGDAPPGGNRNAESPRAAIFPARGGLTRVESPLAATGQAASLKSGLAALPDGVAGAMILLGDMPLVTPELVRRLAGSFRAGRFLVPLYQGRRGNPVTIPAEWFPKVMELTGDTGARPLLTMPGAPVDYFETGDPAVLTDLDTPEDYSRHMNQP